MCSLEGFLNQTEIPQMFLRSFPTWCAGDFSLSPVNQQRGGYSKNNSPSRQCWLEGGAAAKSLLCTSFTLSSSPQTLLSLISALPLQLCIPSAECSEHPFI